MPINDANIRKLAKAFEDVYDAGYNAGKSDGLDKTITPRDYIEDFADEDNGDYLHTCNVCGKDYRGHKRNRPTCKACHLSALEKIMIRINQEKFQPLPEPLKEGE